MNWKPKSYRVLERREIRGTVFAEAGDIVFDCKGHDYGCANDDTRHFGFAHKSVTKDEGGDYPFFTIPERDLQPVEAAQ